MSTSSAPPPINRRLALAALGLGVFAPNVLAACAGTVAKQSQKKEAPAPHLKFEPADAASDVVPTAPASVQVGDGWFQKVALTNFGGNVVQGDQISTMAMRVGLIRTGLLKRGWIQLWDCGTNTSVPVITTNEVGPLDKEAIKRERL